MIQEKDFIIFKDFKVNWIFRGYNRPSIRSNLLKQALKN